MSTLVGYDSSSEDEESTQEQEAQKDVTGGAKIGTNKSPLHTNGQTEDFETTVPAITHAAPERSKIEIGPMVGPVMPGQRDADLGQEIPTDAPAPYSERDAIRYLTRPSHPMTSIPTSPPGSPDPALNVKFQRFLELKARGIHFNDDLGKKSTFRNPGLLSTLMARAGLESEDQYKTSLALSLWDPQDFPPYAYKEELLRSQQSLREQEQATKKSLSVAGKRTIEFTSGGTSGNNSRDSTPGISGKRKRG